MTAQLLPFVYVANSLVRREESLLYNDQFMAFFCVLGIYFIICKDMPLISAYMFTISLGIKAGAILFMPAFFGIIMYRYGLTRLTMCLIIIIVWQIIIALPFVMYQLGGQTNFKTYI